MVKLIHLPFPPLSPQILCFLIGCLLICFIGSLIFEFVYGQPFTIYADYFNSAQDQPEELAIIQIFSNLIVLNTFVPISLYVRWVELLLLYACIVVCLIVCRQYHIISIVLRLL